jgi:hypothetical protein
LGASPEVKSLQRSSSSRSLRPERRVVVDVGQALLDGERDGVIGVVAALAGGAGVDALAVVGACGAVAGLAGDVREL